MILRAIILSLLVVFSTFNPSFANSKAQIFQTLLTSQRAAGTTLAAGKVYFYVPGTTTYKTVYANQNKTTPAANPYTLSADGTAMLYGDGLYDVALKTSAGVQKALWKDVSLIDILTAGVERQNSDFTSLNDAVTQIGSTPTTLNVSTAAFSAYSSVTVPSTLTLKMTYPGSISIASGKVVTFVNAVFDGIKQIFTGSGAITGLKEARPEWFGTGDNSATIQAAINSMPNGGNVLLSPKRYTITTPLAPVAYTGHGGALKTMKLIGSGSARGMTDLAGSYNYGTTLYTVNQTNTAVISITNGSRGVEIRNLNIVGQGGSTPLLTDGSSAVELVDASEYLLLDNVTINGFENGVKITGQNNNDFTTINDCNFEFINTVVLNLGLNAYGVWMTNSKVGVYTGIVYKAVANGSNEINPSFKADRNMLMPSVGVVYLVSTGAMSSLDGISLTKNTIEGNSSPATSGYIVKMDNAAGNNPLPVIITGNVINGGDLAEHYSDSWSFVKYTGRGPFIYEGNKVTGYARPLFRLSMYANSATGGGGKIANNSFVNRYSVAHPKGSPYPPIEEYNNYATNYTSNVLGGGGVALPVIGQQYRMYAGIITGAADNVDLIPGYTFNPGGEWKYYVGDSTASVLVRARGTSGTATGLAATVVNGATTATLTSGTTAQKAVLMNGAYIVIGASGRLAIQEVIGDTIYLTDTYGGPTQTAQALSFSAPLANKTWYRGTDPTGVLAGTIGDRVIQATPAAGSPKAWSCTVTGAPATWISEGNL